VDGLKKIKIGDVEVGLVGLDEIFNEIRGLGIEGDVLKEEILKKVKLYNWISERQENKIKSALFEAYKSFCEELNKR